MLKDNIDRLIVATGSCGHKGEYAPTEWTMAEKSGVTT